jgi:hypothetical protein
MYDKQDQKSKSNKDEQKLELHLLRHAEIGAVPCCVGGWVDRGQLVS